MEMLRYLVLCPHQNVWFPFHLLFHLQPPITVRPQSSKWFLKYMAPHSLWETWVEAPLDWPSCSCSHSRHLSAFQINMNFFLNNKSKMSIVLMPSLVALIVLYLYTGKSKPEFNEQEVGTLSVDATLQILCSYENQNHIEQNMQLQIVTHTFSMTNAVRDPHSKQYSTLSKWSQQDQLTEDAC